MSNLAMSAIALNEESETSSKNREPVAGRHDSMTDNDDLPIWDSEASKTCPAGKRSFWSVLTGMVTNNDELKY